MKKDDFEKEIDKRTPIEFSFSDISHKIDFDQYVESAPKRRVRGFPILIGALSCCAAALVIVPMAIVLTKNSSPINDGASEGGHNPTPSQVSYFEPYYISKDIKMCYDDKGLSFKDFGSVKTVFGLNEEFEFVCSGLYYGENDLDASKYNVISSEYIKNQAGKYNIEVEEIGSSRGLSYQVEVLPTELESISVELIRGSYVVGNKYSNDDFRVVKHYKNNTNEYVAGKNEVTFDFSQFDTSSSGTTKVTATVGSISKTQNIVIKDLDDANIEGVYTTVESGLDMVNFEIYEDEGDLNWYMNGKVKVVTKKVIDNMLYIFEDGKASATFIYDAETDSVKNIAEGITYQRKSYEEHSAFSMGRTYIFKGEYFLKDIVNKINELDWFIMIEGKRFHASTAYKLENGVVPQFIHEMDA